MSAEPCSAECLHPGERTSRINCPECGRYLRHAWMWSGYGPDGYFMEWGGTCKDHGSQRDST